MKNNKYSRFDKYKFFQHEDDVLYVCGNKILGLNNLVFQSREEFYNYMRQFRGFTVPEITPFENN